MEWRFCARCGEHRGHRPGALQCAVCDAVDAPPDTRPRDDVGAFRGLVAVVVILLLLVGAVAAVAPICGCTTITIRRGETEVGYTRFLQCVRVRYESRPDGTMAIDYGGDGGGAEAGAAVGAGIKAAGGL
jgi:hypothetical protein